MSVNRYFTEQRTTHARVIYTRVNTRARAL